MEIIKILPQKLKKTTNKAAQIIKKGGSVICPTDTVYGLVADAKNQKALRRLFKIKKRNSQKPVPVFVKNIKMAKKLAKITKKQEEFLKRVWPGKVTTVLPVRSTQVSYGILSKDKKIGLRIPKSKLLNDLLEELNRPLVATSANISGKPASGKIKNVIAQFEKQTIRPDLILDAGNLKPSLPSTVIDLTNYKIIRQGEVKRKEILELFK
jgi:L-threonylcarbamoyladenylate synthase